MVNLKIKHALYCTEASHYNFNLIWHNCSKSKVWTEQHKTSLTKIYNVQFIFRNPDNIKTTKVSFGNPNVYKIFLDDFVQRIPSWGI